MKQSHVIYSQDSGPGEDRTFRFAIRRTAIKADAPIVDVPSEKKQSVVKPINKEERKLTDLTKKSQHVLYRCSSVFPFDFFPDTITIEPTQVNIYQKTFFLTQHLLTIPIKNISDIHVQTSIFFASLTFIDRSFAENTLQIDWLRKDEAYKIRKIVQGLIIATTQDINVEEVNAELLKEQAEKLGNMHLLE